MEPYYYQTLSKAEQSSYQAMQAGLQAFAPSFPVPLLENRALTDVFMKLRLEDVYKRQAWTLYLCAELSRSLCFRLSCACGCTRLCGAGE